MNNKKILAVFGGSFNPPLNSHFSLAQQIVNEYDNIEKVIFVPVKKKKKKQDLLPNKHRYNMLKLVCDKNDKFILSDIEIKQDRQLYTLETLELLQEQYPEYELCFTIGTDNLKSFPTWNNPEELSKKFKILVIERDEDNIEAILDENVFLKEHRNSFIKLKKNIRSNISSSFVRDKLKRGKSIRYLTPDEIYYYIKENKLYNN